jgi:hypothetical protein
MKKGLLLAALLAAGVSLPAMEWELPVVTMKYEVTGGSIESPDPDEDILIPSSFRNTVSLRIRESGRPIDLGLTVRYSSKDYLLQAGDYSYLSLEQDGKVALTPVLDLGYTAGGRLVSATEDYLALKGGIDGTLDLAKGTRLDVSLDAQADLHETAPASRQVYRASAGLSSRIGQYNLIVRYRGEARLPLGAPTEVVPSFLHVGSLSLQWDPNR